jgi:hypothetical protein
VKNAWHFVYAERLVIGLTGNTFAYDLPFHGSNRGSNPRGDANQKHPQGSCLGGFLLKNPILSIYPRNNARSFRVTRNHVQSLLILKLCVKNAWLFCHDLSAQAFAAFQQTHTVPNSRQWGFA